VLAPTTDLAAGALAGDYGGVTAGVAAGVGAEAHLLIGGSNKVISLQPLSVEGDKGINVAAGIATISLKYQP
jgi:microcystin degradation protein MlrC